MFTLQITHKIEANTDVERDYITNTITSGSPEVAVEVIRDFSTGYHSRNGGGDLIQTDGDLPIIDVRHIDAPTLSAVKRTDSRNKRPAQIVFGATVSFLRATLFMLVGVILIFVPPEILAQVPSEAEPRAGLIVAGVLLLIVALCDIGLALAIIFRRNWARILLMLFSVVAIITAFIGNANRSEVITLGALPTVGISILVLLALSSHRARDYASRGRNPVTVARRDTPPGLTKPPVNRAGTL